MPRLNDSKSVFDPTRHHLQLNAVLSIIAEKLESSDTTRFSWLDLGCGRGQILSQFADFFDDVSTRNKVRYLGFDVVAEDAASAIVEATKLKFFKADLIAADLADVSSRIDSSSRFDLITITNTVHELDPRLVPGLILESILRLADDGVLFVYDMEKLPDGELGAIVWTRNEIQQLMQVLFRTFGIDFPGSVKRWKHSKTDGWNILIPRSNLTISNEDIESKKSAAIEECNEKILNMLEQKLRDCREVLQSLMHSPEAVGGEVDDKISSLYDFWALTHYVDAAKS